MRFSLLPCADHPGPRVGAQLQEQPDVEQSPWGTLRPAAVLWIPGRLPLLLRHTGSVTNTHIQTNTGAETRHKLHKVLLHNSDHASTHLCGNELIHKGWPEKFLLRCLHHPSLQRKVCCWNFCTRKGFPLGFWSSCGCGFGPCLNSWNTAFSPDLLPSSNGCV